MALESACRAGRTGESACAMPLGGAGPAGDTDGNVGSRVGAGVVGGRCAAGSAVEETGAAVTLCDWMAPGPVADAGAIVGACGSGRAGLVTWVGT
jgi:hypothetical protein